MHTIKTVLFGMIGVRRKEDHEKTTLDPVHVIFTALSAVIIFIVVLVSIVKIVTS